MRYPARESTPLLAKEAIHKCWHKHNECGLLGGSPTLYMGLNFFT